MHQLVVFLRSANQIELLLTAVAGAVSIVSAARDAAGGVAALGTERQHSEFCTCNEGDTSHCPARDSL
ncbi:hypothetical protein TL10_00215 [Mycolicibacterium llatzerense]|uniref:Uncharacterized protein n=1 Tax=Mycolicibacterium llatzerense TaxID=280871 RepID=A0A0D1LJH7_9MYCO|nr:hypothetical protein TL10_00215 [Mycolicibacterium llatzerense]